MNLPEDIRVVLGPFTAELTERLIEQRARLGAPTLAQRLVDEALWQTSVFGRAESFWQIVSPAVDDKVHRWDAAQSDPLEDIRRSMDLHARSRCMLGPLPSPDLLSLIFLFADLAALLGRPRAVVLARVAWARAISQPAVPNSVYFRHALQDAREHARARWFAFIDAFR